MKKVILILLALLLLGGGAYYFFLREENDSQAEEIELEVIQPGIQEDFIWSNFLPEQVTEYSHGEIVEANIVEPEMSRFIDEIVITIEETNLEEVNEYVEEMISVGWMILYQSSPDEQPYTVRISSSDLRVGMILEEEETLIFNYYRAEEQ